MNPKHLALGVALTATIVPAAQAGLTAYDAQIASDHGGGAGPLPYTSINTSSVSFDGSNGAAFDFGAISGAATFEFILSGDPVAGGRDGFLAVGTNATFSLRYEQWDDTGQLGFTQAGVTDYLFTPAALSPISPTHVAYLWDGIDTMSLFLDGTLAGTTLAPGFEMPTGLGFLGNNPSLNEGMLGTIDRVTVYNSALTPAQIANHADAWLIPEPSGLAFLGLGFGFLLVGRRRR